MMRMRRLDPDDPNDQAMLKMAFEWDTEGIPLWWANAQAVFGADTWEESLARSRRPEQIEVAVLNDAVYSGLITLVLVEAKTYEVFFSAPRRSDPDLLALACFQIACRFLIEDAIAEKLISWVCSRHTGAMRLNLACGMERDGVSMFKGRSHGKPLEWMRMRLTRQRLARLIYGEEKEDRANRDDVGDGLDAEPVPIHDAA